MSKRPQQKPLPAAIAASANAADRSADQKPADVPIPQQTTTKVDQLATQLVRQAVADYINRLEPAAREITAKYYNQIMPRVVVLAPDA